MKDEKLLAVIRLNELHSVFYFHPFASHPSSLSLIMPCKMYPLRFVIFIRVVVERWRVSRRSVLWRASRWVSRR